MALSRRRRVLARIRRLTRNDQLMLVGLALVIGAAAGLGSVGFRMLLALVQMLAFGTPDDSLHGFAARLPWWHLLLATILGGLAVGLYIHFILRDRHPNGVGQVMEASALHGGRMSLSRGLHGALVNAWSLGVGGSGGREGPVVHLGASIGSWVAGRLHLARGLTRTLLACGIAAAVAASFNTPLAGVFFALEVVIGHYALSAFAPIVIASVLATVIARIQYGPFPAFIIPEYSLGSALEFPAFALLGVTAAIAAILLMRSIAIVQDVFARLPLPTWLHPAVGGIALGLIAIAFPHVLGVGYGPTDEALKGLYPLWLLVALIVAKIAATAVTLGSGWGGGMFSPALFVGAMTGGAFGAIAGKVVPELFSGEGAYAMVGMGAVAGAVLGAPISTILIIFELTGDYELSMAVMVATVLAAIIARQLHGSSYFRWMLERRGIDIEARPMLDILRTMTVARVMRRDCPALSYDASLAELRRRLRDAPYGELFVTTADGRLYGAITFADLADLPEGGERVARDLARRDLPVLTISDTLETALALLGRVDAPQVAVVDDPTQRRLVGVLQERDLMWAYSKALMRVRREEGAAY